MITIRQATAADREFVLALADRLADFDAPALARREPEIVDGDRRALAAWFDQPSKPDEALFVAELDGTPAGCPALVTLDDYFTHAPHAHISVLAVDARCRGQGRGPSADGSGRAWATARGHGRLTLSAFVTNAARSALYERRASAANASIRRCRCKIRHEGRTSGMRR